jgi:hypothetical protein
MSTVPALATALAPFATGGFTLGAVWLTHRFGDRLRAGEREAAAKAKVEDTALQLFDAVTPCIFGIVPTCRSGTPGSRS